MKMFVENILSHLDECSADCNYSIHRCKNHESLLQILMGLTMVIDQLFPERCQRTTQMGRVGRSSERLFSGDRSSLPSLFC
jgi:hypothetical protein